MTRAPRFAASSRRIPGSLSARGFVPRRAPGGRVGSILALGLGLGLGACGSNGGDDADGVDDGGAKDGGPYPSSGGGSSASGGAASATGGASGASGGSSSGGSPFGANPPDPSSIDCRLDGDGKTTLVFVNGCNRPLEFRGSDISGGTVAPGGFTCVDVGSDAETLSSKRYWGFLGEDPGGERHTLAEFTFNTDFHDFDWYNISHVDAHNLPMQIVPVARPSCVTLTCEESWLASCPEVGQFRNAAGEVVSCISPDRDDPQSTVALFFESCDDAYAWSGDDQHGDDPSPMRACAGEDWDIVFCPQPE